MREQLYFILNCASEATRGQKHPQGQCFWPVQKLRFGEESEVRKAGLSAPRCVILRNAQTLSGLGLLAGKKES